MAPSIFVEPVDDGGTAAAIWTSSRERREIDRSVGMMGGLTVRMEVEACLRDKLNLRLRINY